MGFITQICRLLVGGLFIFSGFIKANDPIGFGIKLEEYFSAFGAIMLPGFFEALAPMATGMAIVICVIEIVLGVALLLGYKIKQVAWWLLIMIVFFTILTFCSAFYDMVTDCGCFGDAIKLTPDESFTKDLILLVLILVIFFMQKKIRPFLMPNVNRIFIWIALLASTAFSIYTFYYLPVKDFRAYKIGTNIPEGMTIPPDAPKDSIEIIWKYKVGDEIKSFSNDEAPWDIEGAEYIDREEKVVREGYKPPIHDFTISDLNGDEYTEDFLVADYVIFAINYKVEKARTNSFKRVNEIYDWAIENNVRMIGLSNSLPLDIKAYSIVRKIPYETYMTDGTTLKTIIRSNPGIVMLKKGTIMGKWPATDLPSNEELKELM